MIHFDKSHKGEIIEASHITATIWNVEDLLAAANLELESSHSRDDMVTASVMWNRVLVSFKDGTVYEEEGGYDQEVDWKEPLQLRLWTEDYEEVLSEEEKKDLELKEAAPYMLTALEEALGIADTWWDENTSYCDCIEDMQTVMKKAIAKAKGEKL